EDRVDRGEPADGAREVEVGEELLAAVPLELDQEPRAAGPGGEGLGEGGEEEVVDLRAVGARRLLEEGAGGLGGQRDAGAPEAPRRVLAPAPVAPLVPVERQGGRRRREGRGPVARLGGRGLRAGVLRQALGPAPVGRRAGGEDERAAGG